MPRKKARSPQEKKELSYGRDRRNVYGENDKASRKLIPLHKASESRQDRRKVAQEVSSLAKLDEGAADLLESSVRHDVHRVGGWRKAPDEPLGRVVAWAKQTREASVGRKARSRVRQEKLQKAAESGEPVFESDDPDSLIREAKRLRRMARFFTLRGKSGRYREISEELAERANRDAEVCEARAAQIVRERAQRSA